MLRITEIPDPNGDALAYYLTEGSGESIAGVEVREHWPEGTFLIYPVNGVGNEYLGHTTIAELPENMYEVQLSYWQEITNLQLEVAVSRHNGENGGR